MHTSIILIVLPFLHSHFLQSNAYSVDPSLWDYAIPPLEAGNPVSDTDIFSSPNAIGGDDSDFLKSSSLMTMDDDSSAIFSDGDPYTISMDQCSSSSPSSSSLDGTPLRKRLRTRGAFCADTGNVIGSGRVNQNPFLEGFDATESVIDPNNKRQCEFRYETLCCEGPEVPPDMVADCYRCELRIPRNQPPSFIFPFGVSNRKIEKSLHFEKGCLAHSPNYDFFLHRFTGRENLLGPLDVLLLFGTYGEFCIGSK